MAAGSLASELSLGRYVLYDEIASGGMATVHVGRVEGAAGFTRTVAIKRLHPQFARDPDFVAMFVDEARIVSRIRHPNVVQTLDVENEGAELFLVMEYIHGESLAKLLRTAAVADEPIPLGVVSALASNLVRGLHAAHEAADEQGRPLNVVHRDVSPQNVLVGADGVARVIDFGVAKAASRTRVTQDGKVRGKLGYMSPEHAYGEEIDRRSDVFAAGVVVWELISNRRLFEGDTDATLIYQLINEPIPKVRRDVPSDLVNVVAKALEREPSARYQTALEFAAALELAIPPASADTVAAWVDDQAGHGLRQRAARMKEIESGHAERWSSRRLRVASSETPSSERGPITDLHTPVGIVPGVPRRRWLWALLALPALALLFAVTHTSSRPAPMPSAVAVKESAPPPAVTTEIPEPEPVEATPSAPPPSAPTVARPKRPPPPKKPDCRVPYSVDSQGIHHPKPECL